MIALAGDFSPRFEAHGEHLVMLDLSGLERLLGTPRKMGEELRRTAADRGLRVHVAIAAARTAALVLAQARAGLTVVVPGEEAAVLAGLPLSTLSGLSGLGGLGGLTSGLRDSSNPKSRRLDSGEAAPKRQRRRGADTPDEGGANPVHALARWGLRTLGDLAAIPAGELSERLGQQGVIWQRWARGEDERPLVPFAPEERFEESLDLEWPIEGLEPLSFVLGRLCEPLCFRLEQHDRGAVAFHLRLTLVTREVHIRSVPLPAPMRDPRVLRTLALLDLESHPPPAAIDRVELAVEVTEGRILQFGLLARALPTERLITLLARLTALMGVARVGAPALVDSYRPGAFAMAPFAASLVERMPLAFAPRAGAPSAPRSAPIHGLKAVTAPSLVLRRFRRPIPARVMVEQGRPQRVTTDRRGFSGGRVTWCAGPWRSSGEWWGRDSELGIREWARSRASQPWDCDEWDVGLSDGAVYRLTETRDRETRRPAAVAHQEVASVGHSGPPRETRMPAAFAHQSWFLEGILD